MTFSTVSSPSLTLLNVGTVAVRAPPLAVGSGPSLGSYRPTAQTATTGEGELCLAAR